MLPSLVSREVGEVDWLGGCCCDQVGLVDSEELGPGRSAGH